MTHPSKVATILHLKDHKANNSTSICFSLASQFPDLFLNGPEDDRLLKNLMMFLEIEIAKKKKLDAEIQSKSKIVSILV